MSLEIIGELVLSPAAAKLIPEKLNFFLVKYPTKKTPDSAFLDAEHNDGQNWEHRPDDLIK